MQRRGFTLIELLVALFISAVIFAIGYGALQQALANRGAILEALGRAEAALDAFRRACRLGHSAACSKLGPKAEH